MTAYNSFFFLLYAGRGVYNYPDGRTYNGEYREDRRHGLGTETDAEGSVLYKGRWVMGEFQAD